MKENVRVFLEGVRNIPLLSDEGFKSGGFSGVDNRSALHFLIYPFVGALGYSIFRPDELKLDYVVGESRADLALFDKGSVLASFRILALNEYPRLGDVEDGLIRRELLNLVGTGSVLNVITNGIDYRVYVEDQGTFEELVHFNLFELLENGELVVRVGELLLKSEVTIEAGARKLFTEKVMMSRFGRGNFLESRFLVEALRKELDEVSEALIGELAKRVVAEFGVYVTFEELRGLLVAELSTAGNSLASTVTHLGLSLGEGSVGTEVREVEREVIKEVIKEVEVVRELTEAEIDELLVGRVEARVAERLEVEREQMISDLIDEVDGREAGVDVEAMEREIRERVESEMRSDVERDVRRLMEEEYALREELLREELAQSVHTDSAEEIAAETVNETVNETEAERVEVERVADTRAEVVEVDDVNEGTANLDDLLSLFGGPKKEEPVVKAEASSTNYDDWSRPIVDTPKGEEKKDDRGSNGTGGSSGGALDLNSMLGI